MSPEPILRTATRLKTPDPKPLTTPDKLSGLLKYSSADITSGRYRLMLYRFLTDHVPLINACVWTWTRLTAAPGEFKLVDNPASHTASAARKRLDDLSDRLYTNSLGNRIGLHSLLPELCLSLFRDGLFGGFLTIKSDGSGVDRFIAVDAINIERHSSPNGPRLILETSREPINLDRADFYYLALTNNHAEPLGRSILQPIPFVTYIEQQLVSDMHRASHNSGFHRLHVKITPPERITGESDTAYTQRINGYFDATVNMIRACDVDDNPVTWDNVLIEYIGLGNSTGVNSSWFINHRAMIEDICAGTNLAPYLLGYSYGATTTWSAFKFDVVMRQVRSVQAQIAHFLEWIANIDLALAGLDTRCRFLFDNSFAYQATDLAAVQSQRVDSLLKLYQAGLIDQQTATTQARGLI